MGKAAILFLIATGIVVMYGVAGSHETSNQTARHQVDFEETVIAREIARTGFNMAMGIMRQHGDDLQAGVIAVNGGDGYMQGNSQGGKFRAHARFISGHEVEITSFGYFGGEFLDDGSYSGTRYSIDDNFRVGLENPPLQVNQCSRLNAQFISSIAGYCSAIYLQRYLPDTPSGEQPIPEMVFSSGNNRNGGSASVSYLLQPGTQMNLFLAVDMNCNKGSSPQRHNWQNYDVENHVFNPNHYNHIHYGLEVNTEQVGEQMRESIWALVEQHPQNNQRWRIGWEDQHVTSWIRQPNDPRYEDPRYSLEGLKRNGYDGNGWPDVDGRGYRTLRDYGDRPDFSDQVIEVWMEPEPAACGSGEETLL